MTRAIDIVKHYGAYAQPVMGIVGNVLAVRQNVRNASRFRGLEDAIARRDAEFERVRDLLETLSVSVDELHHEGRLTAHDEMRRISDPEFEQFTQRAVEAAIGSQSEAKRRSFARYVAKRLLTDEEDEIIVLRRAMTLTADLSERQLLAMAAIVLVQAMEAPPAPFANRAQAEAFVHGRYAPVITRFKERPWSYSDLEMLSSVGALSGGVRGGDPLVTESRELALVGWLRVNGVHQEDQLGEPDFGTNTAAARYAAAYPTLHAMHRLEIGHLFDEEPVRFQDADMDRLDTLDVTPVGFVMGRVVLEQLH